MTSEAKLAVKHFGKDLHQAWKVLREKLTKEDEQEAFREVRDIMSDFDDMLDNYINPFHAGGEDDEEFEDDEEEEEE